MEDQKEKVVTNVMIASDIFEKSFSTYDSKIELLKNVLKDSNYAKNCKESKEIYECIRILGDNAIEEKPRRYQQQFLAQLMKIVMSNPSYETLHDFFINNNVLLNAFCLMYIHFQDEAISEKEKEAHQFMTGHILECVKKITSK